MRRNYLSFKDQYNELISADWFLTLEKKSKVKKFKKDEYIVREDDDVTGFYFINSGKVKVVSKIDDTRERIMRLSSSGDLVGHRALSSKIFPISAQALTEVQTHFIPRDVFLDLVRENPEFAIFLVEYVAQDLKETEERMKSVIHSDVMVRISLILCMLIDSYGFDTEIPTLLNFVLPRSDMASMAGTSYESVIRTFSKLEDLKIIKIDKKKIHIIKESALRKLSKERSRF